MHCVIQNTTLLLNFQLSVLLLVPSIKLEFLAFLFWEVLGWPVSFQLFCLNFFALYFVEFRVTNTRLQIPWRQKSNNTQDSGCCLFKWAKVFFFYFLEFFLLFRNLTIWKVALLIYKHFLLLFYFFSRECCKISWV